MIIGTLNITIHLSGISSLKEKRSIIKSLIERLKNRFNASVCELDNHNDKKTAVIAAAVISNSSNFAEKQLDTILDFVHRDGRFFTGKIDREVFGL